MISVFLKILLMKEILHILYTHIINSSSIKSKYISSLKMNVYFQKAYMYLYNV